MSSSDSPPPDPIEVKVLPLDTDEYKVLNIDAEEMTTGPLYPKIEEGDGSPFELFKQRMAYGISSLQKAKNSQIISEAKACGIIQYLKWRKKPADYPNVKLSDFSRHTIREYTSAKRMVLIDVPDLGLYNVLAVPKKTDLDVCVAFSDYRRVIHAGQLFDVVHHLHTDSNKNTHCGYRPVYERSKHEYFGIPRSYIRLHCKYCPGCVVELTAMKPRQPHKQVKHTWGTDLVVWELHCTALKSESLAFNSIDFPQPVSWSLEKRVFLVKEFYRNENSIDCVMKNYQLEFGKHDLPQPQTVHHLVRLFEETGSVRVPDEAWLTTMHESHLKNENPPSGSACCWTSENDSGVPADPGDTD